MINYVSIRLTYAYFTKLYLTYFGNKKKALNNLELSHSAAILVMGTMGEIDESKAGLANLQLEAVSWTYFMRRAFE